MDLYCTSLEDGWRKKASSNLPRRQRLPIEPNSLKVLWLDQIYFLAAYILRFQPKWKVCELFEKRNYAERESSGFGNCSNKIWRWNTYAIFCLTDKTAYCWRLRVTWRKCGIFFAHSSSSSLFISAICVPFEWPPYNSAIITIFIMALVCNYCGLNIHPAFILNRTQQLRQIKSLFHFS